MMEGEKMAEIIVKKETLSDQKDLEEIENGIAIENAIAVGETMTRAAIGVARGAAHEIVRETEIARETEIDRGRTAIGRGTAIETETATEALEEATEDLDRDRAIEIDTVDDDYSVKLNCQSNLCSTHNIRRYAEARTDDIVDVGGSAVLSLAVDSPRGGTLSYSIQALIQAPFEDLVLKLDYTIVKVFTSAAPEWTEHEMEVTAGSHTVSWVHRKNPGDASEGDLAAERLQPGITRVDDVRWTM